MAIGHLFPDGEQLHRPLYLILLVGGFLFDLDVEFLQVQPDMDRMCPAFLLLQFHLFEHMLPLLAGP
jgi:hypothetical protein